MSNKVSIITKAWNYLPLFMAAVLLGSFFAVPGRLGRASGLIIVNSMEDNLKNDGMCTLREAIISANKDAPSGKKNGECSAGSGMDTIAVPAGVYILTRTDSGKEDSSSTGDLDIAGDVTLQAQGPGVAIAGSADFTDRLIHVLSGNVTIQDITLRGGNVNGDGGGIYNLASLTLTGVSLTENKASRDGGAVYNAGTLNMFNTTLSGNAAWNSGGGLANQGQANINNLTITNNTADHDRDNGGDGGGLVVTAGTLNIANTIVSGNNDNSVSDQHQDCSGEVNSLGFNLFGSIAGCIVVGDGTGNLADVDPALGPLQDNGGHTSTHALLRGSPAIDSGNPDIPNSGIGTCEVVDQRGVVRPQRLVCDIGAYEVLNSLPQAMDDSYSLNEDSSLQVESPGVLANDSDADGDELTATLVSGPGFGTLTFNPDGSFDYEPLRNYDGPDQFTYIATDGFSNSEIATVSLAILSDGLTEVTRLEDDGPGTLRAAIMRTNESPGSDHITFEITGSGPFVILLQSALPVITDSVFIDGQSQSNGVIVLDGTSAGDGVNGLVITAGDSTIQGLEITRFSADGILLDVNGNNLIEGNIISLNGGSGVSVLPGSTNNLISNNNIHDNGGLAIDLGGDGRTPNDKNDGDVGGNYQQNYPVLFRAVSSGNNISVNGFLNSLVNTDFTVEIFGSPQCTLSGSSSQELILSTSVTTDGEGNAYFLASDQAYDPALMFINATATDPDGNTSEYSDCITVGDGNDSWPTALDLPFQGGFASFDQFIDQFGQSRWFKFTVQPNSELIVTLTGLPANYDLTVYKDIAQAYQQLVSSEDLVRLGAEFAPAAFSPAAFSPAAFSPAAFSPAAFSPAAFSPAAFSPAAFSPAAFSPAAFSPAAFSPAAFSPAAFSPAAFSPDAISPAAFSPAAFSPAAFSPAAFSPAAFSPAAFSPAAFSSAQTSSLIGVSAFEGTAGEGLVLKTWNNTGDFYIRVRGREGAFSLEAPFHLEVQLFPGSCGEVSPITTPSTLNATAGDYETLILVDKSRMPWSLDPATRALQEDQLMTRLETFRLRDDVKAVVVDVGSDERVVAANTQADTYFDCPYAKNLVAGTIKEIVDRYWEVNPLKYILIIGGDEVVPFFRHPDRAHLGPESQYVPPVLDNTASQASLRLNYVLSQDAYGSKFDISLKETTFPIPALSTGRLVETPDEIITMLDAYLSDSDGIVTPNTSLVTGYDFLTDAADAIKAELAAGIGAQPDELITPAHLSPQDPSDLVWSADDLREILLEDRHDLIFLAGHFSAGSALAADYTSSFLASELAASDVDLTNAFVFSAGCHSGYNIVNQHGVPGITFEPDWAQAFARKGATLLAGSGYQYGDTEFLEYSERLYLLFAQQIRTDSGPVAVGQALVNAKGDYLASTPLLRGIHEKALLEATLFGFPMLRVNMPGERLTPQTQASLVDQSDLTDFAAPGPGAELGLQFADKTIVTDLIPHPLTLTNPEDNSQVEAFYLSGKDGVLTNPVEPTLPLEVFNVGVSGTDLVLRGAGFRGGKYTDFLDKLPLSGAPTTEIRGVHVPFLTDIFFPVQTWNVNYFDPLSEGPAGTTRLNITPAQFIATQPGDGTGTMRAFSEMSFRLYYSQNTGTDASSGEESVPGLAGAPMILGVSGIIGSGQVEFSANVVGNPAAGIEEVWVTYTICTELDGCDGEWRSIDLVQSQNDSSLWTGSLDLNGVSPFDIRYILQSVNGVGLVSMATNLGAFYIPGFEAGDGQKTVLSLENPPFVGPYGSQSTFTALLKDGNGQSLGSQRVIIIVGEQARQVITDVDGRATVTIPLLSLPGEYELIALFPGTVEYLPSSDAGPFEITKQATLLTLNPSQAVGMPEDTNLVTATLEDASGRRLIEETVFFSLSGANGSHDVAVITDYLGRARLGDIPLPAGEYTLNAYFSGTINFSNGESITLDDERYFPATASGTLFLNHPPDCSTAMSSYGDWIWPPNNNTFVPVQVVGVSDPDGDPVTVNVTGVWQDEPVNADFYPDAVLKDTDNDGQIDTAELRAERDGEGDGRVYHIYFTASDGKPGGTCSVLRDQLSPFRPSSVRVGVSANQGGGLDPIDQGPLYDSTDASGS